MPVLAPRDPNALPAPGDATITKALAAAQPASNLHQDEEDDAAFEDVFDPTSEHATEDFLAGILDVPDEEALIHTIGEVCDDNDEDHQVIGAKKLTRMIKLLHPDWDVGCKEIRATLKQIRSRNLLAAAADESFSTVVSECEDEAEGEDDINSSFATVENLEDGFEPEDFEMPSNLSHLTIPRIGQAKAAAPGTPSGAKIQPCTPPSTPSHQPATPELVAAVEAICTGLDGTPGAKRLTKTVREANPKWRGFGCKEVRAARDIRRAKEQGRKPSGLLSGLWDLL